MSLLRPRKQKAGIEPAPETARAIAPVCEDRMLRIADVCHMVGLGKSTVYTLIREKRFPPQHKHTARASVWKLSEVQAFIRGEWQPAQATTAPVLSLVRSIKGGAA